MTGTAADRHEFDGLAYAVHRGGRRGGLPLVALHGFTGSGAGWVHHLGGLVASFDLVAPDLPGHGRSGIPLDPARASVERTADDLAGLIDRLGIAPADLLGYSLGARIALRLALLHPGSVRRLVLESPSVGIEDAGDRAARRASDEALADRLLSDGLDAFVEHWEAQPVFASQAALPPDRRALVRSERRDQRAGGLAASLRGAGQGTMEPLASRLPGVTIPTLVIAGALDPIGRARAEAIAAAIPHARLEVIPDAGHRTHLERPTEFRRLLADFLLEGHAA